MRCGGCGASYIGETNNLRLRTNTHRDHASKNHGLYVSKHIFACGSRSFKIMPIFKMHSDCDKIRKQKELHFIKKYKPLLNREN